MVDLEDLDERYGAPRAPEAVRPWENRTPDSLCSLDQQVAIALTELKICVQQPLLRHAARVQNYIWAMDPDGDVKIAVEELAERDKALAYSGYPLLRGYPYDPEPKKLGHPSLLDGGKARIAGEIAFDEIEGELRWVLNPNSGRYCKNNPPSKKQIDELAALFKSYGLDVVIDYL